MNPSPRILTTTVGSYPVPGWLYALPSEQAVIDATRVVFDIQRQAGIDLPTDGELYRFDINHPDTNGMIDYFVSRLGGVSCQIGRSRSAAFREKQEMIWRGKPAGIVVDELSEGGLNLFEDCARAAGVAGGVFKFTVTSPYMLARTLLDDRYGSLEALTLAIADLFALQVRGLPCHCLQIDEANIPGNPDDAPLAAEAINRVLAGFEGPGAVHFCFGNYGGQTVQRGTWRTLIHFLNAVKADHLVLEVAHRPPSDLEALAEIDPGIGIGLGVIDIKRNYIETKDDVARAIEVAEARLGEGRVRYIHPDCGFWMLQRSVADRKIQALAAGRDLYLARS
ncbi:MAG: 5-methyltetrahydropteroyltriglutamate--homocysteine methyltransferase [Verrucomicrobia bacterium]|jgi:5-methyltetrahydropteroyltriglutamate--homocysteine methyltransferase|nr:MAG: 5-methyltetrahydropteroyltriglutamate--homocysteine methyltransferase [Verrucomicrobiota bacterium]